MDRPNLQRQDASRDLLKKQKVENMICFAFGFLIVGILLLSFVLAFMNNNHQVYCHFTNHSERLMHKMISNTNKSIILGVYVGELFKIPNNSRSEANITSAGTSLIFKNGSLILEIPQKKVRQVLVNASKSKEVRLMMQQDGNLVLYDEKNKPLWSTKSHKNPNSVLMMGSGEFFIYDVLKRRVVYTFFSRSSIPRPVLEVANTFGHSQIPKSVNDKLVANAITDPRTLNTVSGSNSVLELRTTPICPPCNCANVGVATK